MQRHGRIGYLHRGKWVSSIRVISRGQRPVSLELNLRCLGWPAVIDPLLSDGKIIADSNQTWFNQTRSGFFLAIKTHCEINYRMIVAFSISSRRKSTLITRLILMVSAEGLVEVNHWRIGMDVTVDVGGLLWPQRRPWPIITNKINGSGLHHHLLFTTCKGKNRKDAGIWPIHFYCFLVISICFIWKIWSKQTWLLHRRCNSQSRLINMV